MQHRSLCFLLACACCSYTLSASAQPAADPGSPSAVPGSPSAVPGSPPPGSPLPAASNDAPIASPGRIASPPDASPASPQPDREASPAPQESPVPAGRFSRAPRLLVGGGFSFGFFNPDAVNDYMRAQTAGSSMQQGFSEMFLNLVPRLTIAYAPIDAVELQAIGELGLAPKVLSTNDSSTSYLYTRVSAGAIANFPIRLADRHAVTLGGGALFHRLAFEDVNANGLGFRVQGGYRFYAARKFVLDAILAYDSIKKDIALPGSSAGSNASSQYAIDELDYSSVLIGVNAYYSAL